MHPSFSQLTSSFNIELVFSAIGFRVIVKFVGTADGQGLLFQGLHLAFKDSIDPKTSLTAKSNRLAPGERSLEKQRFVVLAYKSVFDTVAKVIQALQN